MKKESAAKRTLNLPGVDTRETPAAPSPLGPTVYVYRQVLQTVPLSTHLLDKSGHVLCGEAAIPHRTESPGKAVCHRCRAKASRLRAVVQ